MAITPYMHSAYRLFFWLLSGKINMQTAIFFRWQIAINGSGGLLF